MRKHAITYKWELLILLWFVFFFHQADRQIFNVVLPSIRDELGLSDTDMGLVASILTLFYGLMVPIGGILGDRISKKYIIIVSLLVWSAATLITGLSYTLVHLILLRSIATGGGEAFYAPSASALISEYHQNTRSTALSIHQTALYVGIICSGYLAGYIADLHGWRMAFYIFGGFGIVLAGVLGFRLKNAIKVKDAVSVAQTTKPVGEVIRIFFKKPTALLLTLAFAGFQFAAVGFLTWMPTYLHEKFYFALARSGFDSTFYHFIGASSGVLIGARIADKYSHKITGARGIVQIIGLSIGAVFIYLMGKSESLPVIYAAMAFFGICRGVYDSNIFAALYDVIDVPYRSTATGIMLMFAFIVGSVAPYVLGVLKPLIGLSNGLAFLSVGYIFGAFCILFALLFFYKKDKV
jgi:MFS family permease